MKGRGGGVGEEGRRVCMQGYVCVWEKKTSEREIERESERAKERVRVRAHARVCVLLETDLKDDSIYTCIHTCIHTHTYTRKHTHVHTHTHAHAHLPPFITSNDKRSMDRRVKCHGENPLFYYLDSATKRWDYKCGLQYL